MALAHARVASVFRDWRRMGSTGVHGIPLYELLGARGLAARLVNTRYGKHVAGRKSDCWNARGGNSSCGWPS